MKIISFLEKKHIFQGVQFDVQISVITPRRGNHIEIQHKLWRWIFSDNDNVITTTKKNYAYEKVYVYSIILGSNPLRCCWNGNTSTRSYRWLGIDSCSTTLRDLCHVPRHKRPFPAKERINGGGIYTNNWLEPVPHSAMICIGTDFQPVVGMGS